MPHLKTFIQPMLLSTLLFMPFANSDNSKITKNITVKSSYSSTLALSKNDALIWSVNPDSDSVSVIRTDTNTLISKIAVGDEPRSVALTPNGRFAYVANAADGSVTVIKINNGKADKFNASVDQSAGNNGVITTGSEPNNVVVSPNGQRLFVSNSSQDTITVIDTKKNTIVGAVDLRNSLCNVGDSNRHFQPRGLAVTANSQQLYVTRFISFTHASGVQRDDFGKSGVVCRLDVDTWSKAISDYQPVRAIELMATNTGVLNQAGETTHAFPNQMQNIVIRGDKAYLANIAAAPTGPVRFDTNAQAYVTRIDDIGGTESDGGSINLHLGARDPEAGKPELYFANPWGIAFTNQSGAGYAYAISAASDMLVKLNVSASGELSFTVDADTTRYIDLNDPDNAATSGFNAGKNPLGIVINRTGTLAYVSNYISRNISVVDLTTDTVTKVIAADDLPQPGSDAEMLLVGAEMFYSSRGNFVRPAGAGGSSRNRLGEKARHNCSSCHPRGLTDGIIWQYGPGPRKSIAVNGTFNPHDPSDQRMINATAIFDEVDDADLNSRRVSGAGRLSSPLPCEEIAPLTGATEGLNNPDLGLILGSEGDFEFAPCVLNQFAKPNANRPQAEVQLPGSATKVRAHDALVYFQRVGLRTPHRPMTSDELSAAGSVTVGGVSSADIAAGEQLYLAAGCQACHNGGKWTKSHKDFVSPPDMSEVFSEGDAPGANPFQSMDRFLTDIGSWNLNVAGENNGIPGYREIGGIETDSIGRKAMGFDHNGDGKGNGYNTGSILGSYSIQPYYHNGACETILCVLSNVEHRRSGLAAGATDPLDGEAARKQLATYIESIDERTATH